MQQIFLIVTDMLCATGGGGRWQKICYEAAKMSCMFSGTVIYSCWPKAVVCKDGSVEGLLVEVIEMRIIVCFLWNVSALLVNATDITLHIWCGRVVSAVVLYSQGSELISRSGDWLSQQGSCGFVELRNARKYLRLGYRRFLPDPLRLSTVRPFDAYVLVWTGRTKRCAPLRLMPIYSYEQGIQNVAPRYDWCLYTRMNRAYKTLCPVTTDAYILVWTGHTKRCAPLRLMPIYSYEQGIQNAVPRYDWCLSVGADYVEK
jgi:hypothetical protein